MAEIHDQFATAFREIRSAVGVSVTIAGATVTAVISESPLSRDLVDGGFQADADSIMKVLLTDLSTVPVIGQVVTYKGKTWKITAANVQPGHAVGSFTIKPVK